MDACHQISSESFVWSVKDSCESLLCHLLASCHLVAFENVHFVRFAYKRIQGHKPVQTGIVVLVHGLLRGAEKY